MPLIAKMLNRTLPDMTLTAELTTDIPPNGIRDHYMRAAIDWAVSPPRVTPLSNQDSSLVTILASANALIIVPAHSPALPAGSRVTVMPLDF